MRVIKALDIDMDEKSFLPHAKLRSGPSSNESRDRPLKR